jgi:hypothetical protein
MMEDAFLQAVIENPADDAPRLMFAALALFRISNSASSFLKSSRPQTNSKSGSFGSSPITVADLLP